MWSKVALAQLDEFYPPCGSCAFCGHRDKRHRLWDSLMDSPNCSPTMTAREFGVSREHVRSVWQILPYRRGGHLLTPNA
jgi:hypothetical protein